MVIRKYLLQIRSFLWSCLIFLPIFLSMNSSISRAFVGFLTSVWQICTIHTHNLIFSVNIDVHFVVMISEICHGFYVVLKIHFLCLKELILKLYVLYFATYLILVLKNLSFFGFDVAAKLWQISRLFCGYINIVIPSMRH